MSALFPTATVQLQLSPAACAASKATPAELLERWLGRLSPSARRKYGLALRGFATWALHGVAEVAPADAMRLLVQAGPTRAHALAEAWRDHLLAAGRASATAAAYLAALASLVTACRRAGLVDWSLEGVAPRVERRQDRAGPPRHEVERVLAYLDDRAPGDAAAARDGALVRLLHNAALRRAEVVGLCWPAHVDLAEPAAVWPLRKGHTERTRMLVGRRAAESLRLWVGHRGDAPGPLFLRLRGRACGPLSGEAVRLMLRSRARQAGCRAVWRPHGLRHAAATEAARRGSLLEVRALGGWDSLSSVQAYLDSLQETRAQVVARVEA